MGEGVFITCRKKDIRRVRINCRCGEVSVAEFPEQIATAVNLHTCPKCGAVYGVTRKAGGNAGGQYQVERADVSVRDIEFR